jgi:hypothetical protein
MDSERTESSMHMRAPVTAPLSLVDTIAHSATMHVVAFYRNEYLGYVLGR